MFIPALFTITKIWKKLKYPSTDEWIEKRLYIHTMEYYSAIKKILAICNDRDGTRGCYAK